MESNTANNGDYNTMNSGVIDERRKLSDVDYMRIQFQYNTGYTIRMISNEHGISTKYVKKILTNAPAEEVLNVFYTRPDICSGCLRHFDSSGLLAHYEMYTSGNIKPLDCFTWMPR